MDLFSGLADKLHVTEITIPAYSNDEEDERIQADILEYLYGIWFSHPAVEQIVYWNLVDGYAHTGNRTQIKDFQGNMLAGENVYYGGLLRFDLTPKPAYERLKELILKKWHTDLTLSTSEQGSVEWRGFFGEYLCTVEQNGKSVTLPISIKKGEENAYSLTI